tara:strand:+ start:928 stop:1503 length:576 start_codon:yes stop_codon:yes gene_type:complete
MSLELCKIDVCLREVNLSDKPIEMLHISPKGTVPILVLPDETVIDESLAIMIWSLKRFSHINKKTHKWLDKSIYEPSMQLIHRNDNSFKALLDKYKYCTEPDEAANHREKAEWFLILLNDLLEKRSCLLGDELTLADIAIFPFIRQFALVDYDWFLNSRYKALVRWLQYLLTLDCFNRVMLKQVVFRSAIG